MKNLTHKIQLNPNKHQEKFLDACCGVHRYTWNWILNEFKNNAPDNKFLIFNLRKQFNSTKKTDQNWMYQYPKDCNQVPFRDFAKTLKRVKNKVARYPKFKSKRDSKQSFYVSNDKFKLSEGFLRLPKQQWIRVTENLRLSGKIMGLRIVKENNHWYACFSVEGDFSKERKDNGIIGLDLGIKSFLHDSNNKTYKLPEKLKKIDKRIKRRQRQISRSIKGSQNRNKKKIKLNKQYENLKNIRRDFLHKTSTKICSENQTIKLEDLNVKGMLQNHNLARSIQNSCWSLFRQMIEYKSKIYNNTCILVDQFYPSSKTCSSCGNKKEDLKLSDRIYKCSCGNIIDRDLNAALNIKNYIPVANGELKSVDRSKNGMKQKKERQNIYIFG